MIRIKLSLIVMTLAALALLATACSPSAAKLTADGNDAFAQQAYEEALQAYSQAQAKSPELAEPYYNAANVLYREGKYEEALKALQAAAQVRPVRGRGAEQLLQRRQLGLQHARAGTRPSRPIARRCCAIPTTWTPRSTWSWPCSRSNSKNSRISRTRSNKTSRISRISRDQDQQQDRPRSAGSAETRINQQDGQGQQDQQNQDQQPNQDQQQNGQDQQDQQNQDQQQGQQSQSQGDQAQQDQQQGQDGQAQADQQQQDGEPQDGSQLAPGQRMTQDQARQLLAAIAGKSDTLQSRLGQFLRVRGRPPVQDW